LGGGTAQSERGGRQTVKKTGKRRTKNLSSRSKKVTLKAVTKKRTKETDLAGQIGAQRGQFEGYRG